jgi:RimJ/RimL family protein N-acetyltransferase
MPTIETPRLRLRPLVENDLDALTALYAHPEVARYLGSGQPLDRAHTWRQIATILGHQVLRGYTMLAVEDRATGQFLGRIGPWQPEGWPMLEVGWVIDPTRQGEGLATEGGRAVLDWCFTHLPVDQICSLIAPANSASARVAAKLGARRDRTITLLGQTVDLWLHQRPSSIARPPEAPAREHATDSFEIRSHRFRLRPFVEHDLDDLARLYTDADVMRYIGEGKTLDRADTWRQIACFLGHRQLRGFTTLAIEDQRTGVFVGECGPWNPAGWPMLEIGWLVDPRRQGQGIATEVARAALDWCFANLNVDRICSIIHPDNLPSRRVAEKLGARIERQTEAFGRPQDLWIHTRPTAG